MIKKKEIQINFLKKVIEEDGPISTLDQDQFYGQDEINTGCDMLEQFKRSLKDEEAAIKKLRKEAKELKPSRAVVGYAYKVQKKNKARCC